MIKLRTLLVGVVVLFAFPVLVASAAAPPGPFFNGFETDTAGWVPYYGSTITRVPSGSSGTYAPGVAAATGGWYARLGKAPDSVGCEGGGGTLPWYVGPYTQFGGYSSTFPTGGYSTGVDIYLDVAYARSHPDTRFDWDSSISDTNGGFRRDYVFNVGTDSLGFVISASNNSNRCGANPTGPVHVTQSGWYTFKHTFTGTTGTPVVATLQVIQKATNALIGSWTLTNPTDIIGTTVGGNHYGWFVQNEFDGLPIDNSYRTGIGPPAIVTLAPAAATDTVGTQHCVTATVTDEFGHPLKGVTVQFAVPTAATTDASPSSGSVVTDANGKATFCYSASLPGEDAISAYADTNSNGMQDADEPSGQATETWTLPPSTSLCQVTITEGGWIIAKNGDRANFGGNAQVAADGTTVQGQQEYQDQGPAQPLNVHSTQLTATTCTSDGTAATIFGTATIDGAGTHTFRIDVVDHGSPSTNDSYGIILDTGYASGQKPLQGGNITIHN